MSFDSFLDQAFLAFLVGTFTLAAWFCKAVVVELREMKKSIAEMNVTLAVVINNQSHQREEIDELKGRMERLEFNKRS